MNATRTEAAAAAPPLTPVTRVLIVDDEQTVRRLAAATVNKGEFEADETSSGEEAVELYRKSVLEGRPYAVVLMDIALPGGISGLEATLAIRQIDGNARVIVSSGYLEQKARHAALGQGFAGILPKPYAPERLTSELRRVLKADD